MSRLGPESTGMLVGRRPRGRLKNRYINIVREDMKLVHVTGEDGENRGEVEGDELLW